MCNLSKKKLEKDKTASTTNAPPFSSAKLGLGVSGPYPTTSSGNKYIISFVDWYSGWP